MKKIIMCSLLIWQAFTLFAGEAVEVTDVFSGTPETTEDFVDVQKNEQGGLTCSFVSDSPKAEQASTTTSEGSKKTASPKSRSHHIRSGSASMPAVDRQQALFLNTHKGQDSTPKPTTEGLELGKESPVLEKQCCLIRFFANVNCCKKKIKE